jgi:hypothetical protein
MAVTALFWAFNYLHDLSIQISSVITPSYEALLFTMDVVPETGLLTVTVAAGCRVLWLCVPERILLRIQRLHQHQLRQVSAGHARGSPSWDLHQANAGIAIDGSLFWMMARKTAVARRPSTMSCAYGMWGPAVPTEQLRLQAMEDEMLGMVAVCLGLSGQPEWSCLKLMHAQDIRLFMGMLLHNYGNGRIAAEA